MLQGSIDQLNTSLENKKKNITEMVDMKERVSHYSDDKPDISRKEPNIGELLGVLGRGQDPFGRQQGPFGR